jgi:signal recognition particle subunit SRP54
MTPQERADPKIINASRRQRIARGSGVAVSDVNDLVNRFFEARKMMRQMAGRMGLPGAGGRAGARRGKKGKKGKGRGPTPPKARGGMQGLPAGMPDLSHLPPGLNELPPGLAGLDQLPFDPSKLKLPKNK